MPDVERIGEHMLLWPEEYDLKIVNLKDDKDNWKMIYTETFFISSLEQKELYQKMADDMMKAFESNQHRDKKHILKKIRAKVLDNKLVFILELESKLPFLMDAIIPEFAMRSTSFDLTLKEVLWGNMEGLIGDMFKNIQTDSVPMTEEKLHKILNPPNPPNEPKQH